MKPPAITSITDKKNTKNYLKNLSLVGAAGIGAIFMALWKGFKVGQARKKFGVNYPDMYSKDSKVRNYETFR